MLSLSNVCGFPGTYIFHCPLDSKIGVIGSSKPGGNNRGAGFTVFCEDDTQEMSSIPPQTGEWQVPPTKPIGTKENTSKPGKWNEAKVNVSQYIL